MIDMYFNDQGGWWQDAADVTMKKSDLKGHFFLASAPDVPRWRLSLDIESGVVTDCYEGMTTEEAEAQLEADIAAEAAQASDDPA